MFLSLFGIMALVSTPVSPQDACQSACLVPEVLAAAGVVPAQCAQIQRSINGADRERARMGTLLRDRRVLSRQYATLQEELVDRPFDVDVRAEFDRVSTRLDALDAALADLSDRLRLAALSHVDVSVQRRVESILAQTIDGIPTSWRVLQYSQSDWAAVVEARASIERSDRRRSSQHPEASAILRAVTEHREVREAEARLARHRDLIRAAMQF